jgi:hypothetical protein
MGQREKGCVESRDTHSVPSWEETEVNSGPGGRARKGMIDIWVGKNSMRRKCERTVVLHFTTHDPITKSVPDPSRLARKFSKK